MDDLKLIAFDEKDLEVISAAVQDSIVMPSEIVFDASAKHIILPLRRYAWENQSASPTRKSAVLRIINVINVQSKGVDRADQQKPLSLLSISSSSLNETLLISMTFANDAKIVLAVQALELELRDLGAAWAASRQPKHGI